MKSLTLHIHQCLRAGIERLLSFYLNGLLASTEHAGHSHMTFGVVERSVDGGFSLKALKQKQMVDGLCYLLQEIYGIENKNAQRNRVGRHFGHEE